MPKKSALRAAPNAAKEGSGTNTSDKKDWEKKP
jgi:hypothetical protein